MRLARFKFHYLSHIVPLLLTQAAIQKFYFPSYNSVSKHHMDILERTMAFLFESTYSC